MSAEESKEELNEIQLVEEKKIHSRDFEMSEEHTKDEVMSDFIKIINQHKKNDASEIKYQKFGQMLVRST
jgi:hypothetical protein